jgi:hypothetical protein
MSTVDDSRLEARLAAIEQAIAMLQQQVTHLSWELDVAVPAKLMVGPLPAPASPAAAPHAQPAPATQPVLAVAPPSAAAGVPTVPSGAPVAPAMAAAVAPAEPVAAGPSTAPLRPAAGHGSSEDRARALAGQWALLVGAAALFLAAVLFLSAGWASLPPVFKPLIGIGAAASALLAARRWGAQLQPWAREGLVGLGIGLLYTSAWGAFSPLQLVGALPTLAVAVGLTLYAWGASQRLDARSPLAIAWLGAYMAPLWLEAGTDQHLTVALYALVLQAGALFEAYRGRQVAVLWGGWLGTALLLCVGLSSMEGIERTVGWLACAAAASGYFVVNTVWGLRAEGPRDLRHDALVMVATAGLMALMLVNAWPLTDDAQAGLAVLGSGLPLAAAAVWKSRRAPQDTVFTASCALGALGLLTLAVPVAFEATGCAVSWTLEAVALALLAVSHPAWALAWPVRIVSGLAGFALVGVLCLVALGTVDASLRGGVLYTVAVGTAAVVIWTRRHGQELGHTLVAMCLAACTLLWGFEAFAGLQHLGVGSAWREAGAGPRLGFTVLGPTAMVVYLGVMARRWQQRAVAQVATLGWVFAAAGGLLAVCLDRANHPTPFTAATALAVLASGVALTRLARGALAPMLAEGGGNHLATLVAGFTLLASTIETYRIVSLLPGSGSNAAWLSVSVVWAVLSAVTILMGMRLSHRHLRQGGFLLGAATALKVVFTDVGVLDTAGRVVVFTLVGLGFLGVGLVYGKRREGSEG